MMRHQAETERIERAITKAQDRAPAPLQARRDRGAREETQGGQGRQQALPGMPERRTLQIEGEPELVRAELVADPTKPHVVRYEIEDNKRIFKGAEPIKLDKQVVDEIFATRSRRSSRRTGTAATTWSTARMSLRRRERVVSWRPTESDLVAFSFEVPAIQVLDERRDLVATPSREDRTLRAHDCSGQSTWHPRRAGWRSGTRR